MFHSYILGYETFKIHIQKFFVLRHDVPEDLHSLYIHLWELVLGDYTVVLHLSTFPVGFLLKIIRSYLLHAPIVHSFFFTIEHFQNGTMAEGRSTHKNRKSVKSNFRGFLTSSSSSSVYSLLLSEFSSSV